MSSVHELPDLLPQVAAPPVPAQAVPAQAVPARARLAAVPDPAPLDFDEVVRNLTPRLQRYATRRLGDRHEAEELVQEALLRAYDHRDELATEDDVAAWSTCVTGRLVIDRLRVRGRSTCVAEVPEGTRVGRDTADVVVARDEARTALDALDAMPARQAAVLWAREVEGLAYGEICERFGMTEPAVRSVLSRARKALRKEFETRGGTLPAAGLVALAPWVDGLTWVDRLRRVAARATAPAALGVAGLGVLTGALVAPWSSPADAEPRVRPVVTSTVSVPPAPAAAPVAQRPAAPTRAAVPAAPVRAASPAAVPVTVLERTPLADSCVGAAGAGAGSASCNPEPVRPALYVDLPLPSNAAGVSYLGVETSRVPCEKVDAVPLIGCTEDRGETR